MATKKELVKSILDNKNNTYSQDELNKKTNKDLETIANSLDDSTTVQEVATPVVDMASIIAEMKATMKKELEAEKENIRKELELEMQKSLASESESLKEKAVANTPTTKVEIDRYRQVPVMNLTNGTLVYVSRKTGAEWIWGSYADVDYLEFHEIQTMRTSQKAFIDDPLIMILDDEVVNFLGLSKFYETILSIDSLEKVFRMNNEDFKEMIEKAPKGIIVSIVSKAREMASAGTLDSVWKIKYLNEKFNTDIGQRG